MSVHDLWNGKRTGPGKRWQVRYREAGRQHKRNFDTKESALAFEARRRLEPEQRLAREGRLLTVAQMMATWLATKTDKARKTQQAYGYDARQVTAEFGDRLASSVRPSEIRVWVARPGGASVRRRSLTALQAAYALAMEDELLSLDPTARIKLPKAQETERRFLSWFELKALATETGDHAPLVWLLGTSGLRLGEAAGLQVGDVRDGKLRVVRQRHGPIVEPPRVAVVEMCQSQHSFRRSLRRRVEGLTNGCSGERDQTDSIHIAGVRGSSSQLRTEPWGAWCRMSFGTRLRR